MGFKLAVVLCLSFALAARAQIGTNIASDLNAKENQLNCLLGKPSCISPPPAPTTATPPPAAEPPIVPPTVAPPTVAPPTPAPAPAVVTGTAVAVISISLPDGYVLSDTDRARLVALIQNALGPDAVVELQVTGGRKLLALSSITLLLTQVIDCATVGNILNTFIPGEFVTEAINIGIPVLAASLNSFACTFPGQLPYTISNPPASAPTAPPTSGPAPSG